jgi:hypothetical protein
VPITVGNPAVLRGNIFGKGFVLVPNENPAPTAGTLTTVKYYATTGGTVVFMTGTGTWTFTVGSVTASLTAVAGLNTFSVSLPIPTGGRLALWTPSSGGAVSSVQASTGTVYYKSSASAPTAGAALAMSDDASLLSLQGVGS